MKPDGTMSVKIKPEAQMIRIQVINIAIYVYRYLVMM